MAGVINFYRTGDDYGSFSNFAPYPIEVGGKVWPTAEHYFQAQKFAGTEHEERMRLERSPMVVARMGRDRDKPLRLDWEAVKDDIMRKAVIAKFTQHAEIRAQLLDTGDAKIVEHTANDSYWGDSGDGSGRNMLGLILMEVREQIRRAAF
jgi:hypothetical protein